MKMKEEIVWKNITYGENINKNILEATFAEERLFFALKSGKIHGESIPKMTDGKYIKLLQVLLGKFSSKLNRLSSGSGISCIGYRNDGAPRIEKDDRGNFLVSEVVIRKEYDHDLDFKSPTRKLVLGDERRYDRGVIFHDELAYVKYLTDGNFKNGRMVRHVYRFFLLANDLSFTTRFLFESSFDDIEKNIKNMDLKTIQEEVTGS
jgi:hypothetical protein